MEIWWWQNKNCAGYPENVYDELLHENEQKQGEINIIKGSDRIVSML